MNLQKALLSFNVSQRSSIRQSLIKGIDPRALIGVTFLYLFFLLSLPLEKPASLIWFAIYPIILSPLSDLSYSKVFLKSFYILPFILLIGVFNPFLDYRPAMEFGGRIVSMGWITFFSIILRGLLTFQALYLLINNCGFLDICNSMQRLGLPKVLTVQLQLLYRYINVFIEEALKLHYSVVSRGYGKKNYSISLWTRITGNLFLRTLERSKRIHNSMISRGFTDYFPSEINYNWNFRDTIYTLSWLSLFLILYFVDISYLLIPA